MGFNLLDLLLPRETKFFTYLIRQSDQLVEACRVFRHLVVHIEEMKPAEIKEKLDEIKGYELAADKFEQTIIGELNKTFITPLDREDIHTLTLNVDRSVDILNSIARKMEMYLIRSVPENVPRFADLIVDIALRMRELFETMEKKKNIYPVVEGMHQVENQADELFHASMAELFGEKYKPIEVIKFKELYENLEHIVDSIDYVGKLVRGIMVKQG